MDLDSDAQTSAKAALLAPLCTVLPLDQGFHIIGNPEIQDSVDIYLWEYSYAVTGTTYTASAGVLLDSDPHLVNWISYERVVLSRREPR